MTKDASTPIPDIPGVPIAVKQAAEDSKLVLFVGAGVSKLAGCPGWSALANYALGSLRDRSILNHADVDQLRNQPPKQQLSIAKSLADAKSAELDLGSQLLKEPNSDDGIHSLLASIPCSFVTTNYDTLLENTPRRATLETGPSPSPVVSTKVAHSADDLRSLWLAEPGSVQHIHGSTEDNSSMIVSTEDYLALYKRNDVQEFLADLFKLHTVVIMGYGLEEWELLEHILRATDNQPRQEPHLFMLSPFFSHEQKLASHLATYYRDSFAVELLPYRRDENDYEQLTNVIDDWTKQIRVRPKRLSDKMDVVDELLEGEL